MAAGCTSFAAAIAFVGEGRLDAAAFATLGIKEKCIERHDAFVLAAVAPLATGAGAVLGEVSGPGEDTVQIMAAPSSRTAHALWRRAVLQERIGPGQGTGARRGNVEPVIGRWLLRGRLRSGFHGFLPLICRCNRQGQKQGRDRKGAASRPFPYGRGPEPI